jgi:hypothetical protein
MAGRLFRTRLLGIAHLSLAKSAANGREEQQSRKHEHGTPPNYRECLPLKAHEVRLRQAKECVNAWSGA